MATSSSELDAELVEIIADVGRRRAALIEAAAREIAADIRSDADRLKAEPVPAGGAGQLRVLHTLPACTYAQSKLWRYQLAAAADRLAADTSQWGAPIPRCTGEEMALHLILRRARHFDPRRSTTGWELLGEVLFQDHDVLMLYELAAADAENVAGAVNLDPRRWFTEFGSPFSLPDRK